MGPLVLKENRPEDGQVIVVTYHKKEVRRRYHDVRHTLLIATEPLFGKAKEAMATITTFAMAQRPGTITTLGWAPSSGGGQPTITRGSSDNPTLLAAVSYAAKCLGAPQVEYARLVRGTNSEKALWRAERAVTLR